jgi:hypothetical protein
MPIKMTKLLELLGLSTSVLYAAATYGFFHFLDRKASPQAKAAINKWFRTTGHNKADVSNAVLELFGRIYERPLWSIRSLLRSATLSVAITSLFTFGLLLEERASPLDLWHPYFAVALLTIILSDYASLFLVRKFLSISQTRPMWSLVWGAMAGMIVVVIFYVVRAMLILAYTKPADLSFVDLILWASQWEGFKAFLAVIFEFIVDITNLFWMNPKAALILPALAVHLWLPLIGIGVAITRTINSFAWSVNKMQWFLKQGRSHPLQAIGYVAATVVFVVITLSSILGRSLS